MPMLSQEQQDFSQLKAMNEIMSSVPANMAPFQEAFSRMVTPQTMRRAEDNKLLGALAKSADKANFYASAYREGGAAHQRNFKQNLAKSRAGQTAKSVLDVGTNTNFTQISGGQSLGYVSLDTQLARGTIRPDSFALYQSLPKSAAFQVVDYWAYTDDIGGGPAGTNFTGFGNVSSGTLNTSAGQYNLLNVNLKLATNGRALTTALAAQNSFVDIAAQENANAALSILEDFDWAGFWGNPTLYPNQPQGLYQNLLTNASGNIYNFQSYATNPNFAGLSNDQLLFNLIYDVAAQITKWGKFGHITHAFMSQTVVASLQSLTTTLLNNIVNVQQFAVRSGGDRNLQGMTINGDIDGMMTRFGQIRFPVDIQIDCRDIPVQAVVYENGTTYATTSGPTPPTGVTSVVSGGAYSGSLFTSAYTASSGQYVYAVASTNANFSESVLAYAAPVTGVTTGGAITVTIAPPVAADATVFRVYRSGLGYTAASNQNPACFRYIGSVAASGTNNVTYVDYNQWIPGSESIFLLDMDDNDKAIDFRFLLPLTKIELFAQNLYMPWAVAMIGAPRFRIPKFHAMVTNFVPDNPKFNPLQSNVGTSW